MATKTVTRATAANGVDACAGLAEAAGKLDHLVGSAHFTAEHQVLALLHAAENLADCHRVLDDVKAFASRRPQLYDELRGACSGMNDPFDGVDGQGPFGLIQDLLRVASNLQKENAARLEEASTLAFTLASDTKKATGGQ